MTFNPEALQECRSDTDVLDLASTGDGQGVLDWFRRRGDESLWFFAKVICGYKDLTPHFHLDTCRYLVQSEADRIRGLLMPRKFLKSTLVKAYVTRRIKNWPDIRVLFVGENDDVGSKNLTDIRWNIQENALFRALYPHLIPPDNGTTWSSSAIVVPRSRSYDEPTINTIGVGAKHTGFHYNLIVYDDMIGLAAAGSPAIMKSAIEWYQAAPGLHDSPDTQELIVGTRWKDGLGDLYGWIMEEQPEVKWFTRSIIRKNGEPLWPERYPHPEIEAIRKRTKTYLFNANYMNDPTTKEGTDFQPEWIQTYRISDDRRFAILNNTGERVSLANLVRISIYDPSAGGKNAEAENAIVVAGMDYKRRILALEAWSKNCGFGAAIEQWHILNDKWHCWKNYYEAVGAHKAAGEMIRMRQNPCPICKKNHVHIRAEELRPDDRSKEDRIRALAQPAFEEGRVYIGEHMVALRKQIEVFPHGTLVDIFDCLAYAISKLRAPTGVTEEDEERRVKLAAARTGEPRTHAAVDYGGYS